MKCHGNNEDTQGGKKHNPMKHMLHMIICCGLPVIIILSIPFIARFSTGTAGMLGIIAPFICPILMIGMMVMMTRNSKRTNKKATDIRN